MRCAPDVLNPPRRFDLVLVHIDPVQGPRINTTRTCLIISPDEMNTHLRRVMIAPVTSRRRAYPTRVDIGYQGRPMQVVLDQIHTVDKTRLLAYLGALQEKPARAIAAVLQEMFAFGG